MQFFSLATVCIVFLHASLILGRPQGGPGTTTIYNLDIKNYVNQISSAAATSDISTISSLATDFYYSDFVVQGTNIDTNVMDQVQELMNTMAFHPWDISGVQEACKNLLSLMSTQSDPNNYVWKATWSLTTSGPSGVQTSGGAAGGTTVGTGTGAVTGTGTGTGNPGATGTSTNN